MAEHDPGSSAPGTEEIQELAVAALRTVYDPEIPVDIYELGLVYKIEVDGEQKVLVEMTLTSPACPAAEIIPVEAKRKITAIEGVGEVDVQIVWDPPWTPERMSEAARLQLGMF